MKFVVMDRAIFDRLTHVFREVFDDDEIVATPELAARDIGGWDSLGNVRLFIEIERQFAVRFSVAEVTSLKNVGELAESIEIKIRADTR